MENFDYLIDRILQTPLSMEPFKHIYVENFFNEDHFRRIIASPEVNVAPVKDDEDLISALYNANFKVIEFPGTTTDLTLYLKWHKNRAVSRMTNVNCEGFGLTLRLQQTVPGTILDQVITFYQSDRFWNAMASRFDIDLAKVTTDIGPQKYLDGYEISPHPDIRKKALTFMININPAEDSETIDYHTRYLRFKPAYEYIKDYWSENRSAERCWVSWDSCEVIKQQPKNNSMVIFSPADDTLHAVKANYDHLRTQRTQFYGNLWYKQSYTTSHPSWTDIVEIARVKEAGQIMSP